jgi:ribosomal protein S15P/S13E
MNLTKHFQQDKKDNRGALRTAQLKKKIDKMLTLDIVPETEEPKKDDEVEG